MEYLPGFGPQEPQAVYIDDLIECEGPLLSIYRHKDRWYFVQWVDLVNSQNFWLVYEVTTDHIGQYINGILSLLDVMKAAKMFYVTAKVFATTVESQRLFRHLNPDWIPQKHSLYDPRFSHRIDDWSTE